MAHSAEGGADIPRLSPAELRGWLGDGAEVALLDIREHGQYGEQHLFFATNLPFSQLEAEAARLLPRPSARIVVHDDGGDEMASRAARRLRAMGYTAVHVLAGGTAAWQAAGHGLFAGVNLPSKTFGELAEQVYHTPHITAGELHRRQQAGDNLVVLDGRPFAEYRKMSIPGAISCPNGELALHIGYLVPDPQTTIVVNCAGRTRSIIGAQTLIDLGLPNPVHALENGTQGWMLADLVLDHGADRRASMAVAEPMRAVAAARVAGLAAQQALRMIDSHELQDWLRDPGRSTYVFDIRSPEEVAESPQPGLRAVPGGQLIQATDLHVPTRGARIVLDDTDGVRAPVVAIWLRRLGWEVALLRPGSGLPAFAVAAAPLLPDLPRIPASALDPDCQTLIDLRPSMDYRTTHLKAARWSIRPRLAADLAGVSGPVVLICDRPETAAMAALELEGAGCVLSCHCGDPATWRAAGLEVVATPDLPARDQCIDYLFFTHDRHDGNREAAQQYLAWETGLLAQVDGLEVGGFRLGLA